VLERFEFPQEVDVAPFTWAHFQKQHKAALAADKAAQAAKQAALDAAKKREEERAAAAAAEAAAAGGAGNSTAANVTIVIGGGGREAEETEVVVVSGGEAVSAAAAGGPAPPAVAETAEALVQELTGDAPSEMAQGGSKYRLTGVVIHQGSSPHLGHYYSYVLCPEDGRWYCVNDASVAPFSLESVEKVWFQGGHASPFLLFYEQVEEEREEGGMGEEEGQAVVVPPMGLPSVAVVLDLMRHLTLTALANGKGDDGPRRRVMNLVGRVLPWAMGLGSRCVCRWCGMMMVCLILFAVVACQQH
jgi:hypothetical protein